MSFLYNSEKFDSLEENFQRTFITDRLAIISLKNPLETGDFAEDVMRGLKSNPKYLPPKYFYDSKGSKLFEKITRLKEYYLTETERSIIKSISKNLPKLNSNISTIVEIGSGSSNKTRHIIEAFSNVKDDVYYMPLDISDIIIESSKKLLKQFDNISIEGIISEYENGLEMASDVNNKPKLYLF